MRKAQKEQAKDFLCLLEQVYEVIEKQMKDGNTEAVCGLLEETQQGMILLGQMIEQSEGAESAVISFIEEYCEEIYQIHKKLLCRETVAAGEVCALRQMTAHITDSINDVGEQLEMLFLPYKASMWDSLESVWMEADADPNCIAYVMPIPYYDRDANGNFEKFHYEGKEFPEYVPIIHYDDYDLEEHQPDVIFIHNPYDNCNYVTSIEPKYYSGELKKYTKRLVYIPYYVTAGKLNEGQTLCPVYSNVDDIIVQGEKYPRFFRMDSIREKVRPFGSPKFDRIIRMCKNPEAAKEEWQPLLKNKTVYFYNTSISHMLSDTVRFIRKMEYIFQCFEGRTDACLIWRPHPLLEATFESMRPRFLSKFSELKRYFIEHNLGIYDDTPDVTKTIALCDVHIGEVGSSLTSMFGIAGKPLFILNRYIDSKPEPEDWRGEIINPYLPVDTGKWKITRRNQLYGMDESGCFRYVCQLSDYESGIYMQYYIKALEIGEKLYICPQNAQDILVVSEGRIEKRIALERLTERPNAFVDAHVIGKYLFLIPDEYPAIVRYDIFGQKIDYINHGQYLFGTREDGGKKTGGSCVCGAFLMIASPTDNRVVSIDSRTGKIQKLLVDTEPDSGCIAMVPDGEFIWLLPHVGKRIICWNPFTGKVREYSALPEAFSCNSQPYQQKSMEQPFSSAAVTEKNVYFAPYWGNMFIRLEKETGRMEKWNPPCPIPEKETDGYYTSLGARAYFVSQKEAGGEEYQLCSQYDRKAYKIDFTNNYYEEIPIIFDESEVRSHEPGFCKESDWLPYACIENAYNTLEGLLDKNIIGKAFDQEEQKKAYSEIVANDDGTCGEKIYHFIKEGKQIGC